MTREEIVAAIHACIGENACDGCPLETHGPGCTGVLLGAVLPYVEAQPPQDSQDAAKMPDPWTREKVLADAKRCVCGERDQSYGGPEDSFRTIANLWCAYMGVDFTPVDVSVMLGLLKVARIAANPKHMDNWVDLAGYAACGGEIAGGDKHE